MIFDSMASFTRAKQDKFSNQIHKKNIDCFLQITRRKYTLISSQKNLSEEFTTHLLNKIDSDNRLLAIDLKDILIWLNETKEISLECLDFIFKPVILNELFEISLNVTYLSFPEIAQDLVHIFAKMSVAPDHLIPLLFPRIIQEFYQNILKDIPLEDSVTLFYSLSLMMHSNSVLFDNLAHPTFLILCFDYFNLNRFDSNLKRSFSFFLKRLILVHSSTGTVLPMQQTLIKNVVWIFMNTSDIEILENCVGAFRYYLSLKPTLNSDKNNEEFYQVDILIKLKLLLFKSSWPLSGVVLQTFTFLSEADEDEVIKFVDEEFAVYISELIGNSSRLVLFEALQIIINIVCKSNELVSIFINTFLISNLQELFVCNPGLFVHFQILQILHSIIVYSPIEYLIFLLESHQFIEFLMNVLAHKNWESVWFAVRILEEILVSFQRNDELFNSVVSQIQSSNSFNLFESFESFNEPQLTEVLGNLRRTMYPY